MSIWSDLRRFFSRVPSPMVEYVAQVQSKLESLDASQVEDMIRPWLDDPAKYRVDRSAPDVETATMLAGLPDGARRFFTEYATVQEQHGDLILSRDFLTMDSKPRPGIQIGADEDADVMVTGEDEVLVSESGSVERHRSIHHLLLYNASFIYEDVALALGLTIPSTRAP